MNQEQVQQEDTNVAQQGQAAPSVANEAPNQTPVSVLLRKLKLLPNLLLLPKKESQKETHMSVGVFANGPLHAEFESFISFSLGHMMSCSFNIDRRNSFE